MSCSIETSIVPSVENDCDCDWHGCIEQFRMYTSILQNFHDCFLHARLIVEHIN